jgi:hypothetical protein
MTKIRTAQGKYIDTSDYIRGDEIAIGNMSINARGDKIDKFGNVLKSSSELAQEYHNNTVSKIKTIPLSDISTDHFMTLNDVVEQTKANVKTNETKSLDKKK